MTERIVEPERGVEVSEAAAFQRSFLPAAVPRVEAAKELLRLERRIARQEKALETLRVHRERLLALIGGVYQG